MTVFKVSDVAKKVELSVEEAIKRLKEAGVDVSTGDDMITEKDIISSKLEPKYQPLDRRQEMLKKALERHKRGVKIREVVMTKSGNPIDTLQSRKVSREDLMKKRSELDQRIKKVDNDRETILKEKPEIISAKVPNNKEAQSSVKLPNSVNKKDSPEDTDLTNVEKVSIKSNDNDSVVIDSQYKKKEFIRPSTDKPSNKDYIKQEKDNRYNRSRQDGTNFARPYTPRIDGGKTYSNERGEKGERSYNRSDRPSSRGQFNRDTERSSGDRAYTPRGDRDRNSYHNKDVKTNRDKPFQKDERFGSSSRGSTTGSTTGRPGSGLGTPRLTGDIGLGLAQEEERKRLVKRKEDDNKDKESRKPKAKKDSKKIKSWTKTITEGIDELNIEKELEHKPISPLIDISDLADVDPDKQKARFNSGTKGRYDKKIRKKADKSIQKVFIRPEKVEIGERVVVAELGSLIGIKATELIKKLFGMGIMATVNQSIDAETAQLLGIEYGVDVVVKSITEDDLLPTYESKDIDMIKRPPIVTVMGHVDHGKTSLLDAIRSTSVATGEAGGITQHIGAYEVDSVSGKITFLDTPGHEAFTTLRARGALLTDIVILVVAADDGVKPQTKEAIDHAKAAGVKMVVAINKIDKEGANSDKVRQQLAEYGIISDEWGGDYQFQEISAKKHLGIDDLLERVLLEAEVLDLKGDASRDAEGIVIESRLDKQKGPVATILVKNGTLRKGDTFIVGKQFGKVRAMFNFKGNSIKEASLSIPVEVMGFSEVPEAGEKFVVADERIAKQVTELRSSISKDRVQTGGSKLSLADFFGKIQEGELKELNIVLKADAQGSLEALSTSLLKLSNQEVKVNIIHDGIGAITESDVVLANASRAIIIGFNVRPDNNARNTADREKIDIELYSVIYKAIDDIKLALEGMLSPDIKENIVGRVELRQIFSVPKIGKIAGCFVLEGKINRNSTIRVIRDSIVIFDGKISSLKRFTDDVKEVSAGYECGLSIDRYQDIKENDILEVYEMVEEKRTLDDVAKSENSKKS